MNKKFLDDLTYNVIGAVIDVHKSLGPGLLESVYHKVLKYELFLRRLNYRSEIPLPVNYKGIEIQVDLCCDFFIENSLLVELKAVNSIVPIHEAQVLSYMKLLKAPKGILINFNVVNIFKEGQKTFVNELFRELPDE